MQVLQGWVGMEEKLDRDGWGWKFNMREWVKIGVISVTMQLSTVHLNVLMTVHRCSTQYSTEEC